MIIFLYGKDTYRMREKLKEILEEYKKIHKSGLNLKYFDPSSFAKGEGFDDFKNGLIQTSMFREKKLAVITNLFSNPEFKEKFFKKKKEFLDSDDVILIYQEDEVDKNDALSRFLEKNAKSQEFKPLEGEKLKNWVKKEFEKYNTQIDSGALAKLFEYVGNDLWRMSNEIKKLVSYKKKVSSEDVKLQVRSKIETDVFKTIDAIAEKNKKQALQLLHKHLEKGDSPLYLLSMINYQFRNLLIVKDFIERRKPYNIILKRSGLHPFVVKKSYFQCQKFSFAELKKIYQKIFQTDLEIKTGKIEPEVALELLTTII